MNLVISERAEDDLARIYTWLISEYEEEAAENFRSRAERALSQLAKHSELGPHPVWTLRHLNLRFWVISRTNYIIYYERTGDRISIERVLDGRRDVRRIIELGIEDPPDEEFD
jgi:plasmid stabilization system protein ParE